jgi:hypothetical protein
MSHHYSGPNLVFPRGDARLDFTDLFAFPKPGEPSKSILIMDVHPSVGVNPPGPTTAEPFAPEALEGVQAAGTGEGGQVIVEGAPVSMGRETQVTEAGDYRFFAGWRSDPFFIDGGALNNFQFTGQDLFADNDVCGIALECLTRLWGRKRFACGHGR